ncbi:MAG: glycerophosphodiester phosphodiesterase family protein [Gammaproteobacteria bacterium]|nr:glycerophosphodiester phosphodiesterase family protein [Gammaproteobacteria bacterium]
MIPKLVAHRGYMQSYPENSLLGLEMAMQAGACMVEFDVQMSADQELIVLHDSDFRRTAGLTESVFDLTLSELSLVSVHEAEKFGDRFIKTPVPTLRQFMELVSKYPAVTAFVELKDESLIQWGLEHVMDAVQKLLAPYTSQSVIISYNLRALQYIKQRGLYPIGWVLTTFDEMHHKNALQLKPQYLICNHKKIPDDGELWQGDWLWMLYDINDPELALQWGARGSELIETADIGTMLQHAELGRESCKRGV